MLCLYLYSHTFISLCSEIFQYFCIFSYFPCLYYFVTEHKLAGLCKKDGIDGLSLCFISACCQNNLKNTSRTSLHEIYSTGSVVYQPEDEKQWSGAVTILVRESGLLSGLFVSDGAIDLESVLWSLVISLDSVPGMQVTMPSSFPAATVPHIRMDPLHAAFPASVQKVLLGFLAQVIPNNNESGSHFEASFLFCDLP